MNGPSDVDWQKTLHNLAKVPLLQAKFLNTLSFMEYVGARKIVKSQHQSGVTAKLLAHIAEETRHAQVFKRLALKMSGGKLASYSKDHTLCLDHGDYYLKQIDRDVEAKLKEKNPWANYLATTLLVEERANLVYPVYDHILSSQGYTGLAGIVAEEKSHLEEVSEALEKIGALESLDWDDLRKSEAFYFNLFFRAVDEAVLGHISALHSPRA